MTKEERLEKLLQLREDYPGGQGEVWTVGEFTYGMPIARKYDDKTKLTIGKFCSIADNVQIILGGEHHTDWITTYPFDVLVEGREPKSKGDVVIGNDVWIGKNVTILSGVTIGDGAVIGAGSVVTKNVSAFSVVAGNPARFIRYRYAARMACGWWDWPIEKIAEALPAIMSENWLEVAKYE